MKRLLLAAAVAALSFEVAASASTTTIPVPEPGRTCYVTVQTADITVSGGPAPVITKSGSTGATTTCP